MIRPLLRSNRERAGNSRSNWRWFVCVSMVTVLSGCVSTNTITPRVTLKEPELPTPPQRTSLIFKRPWPTVDEVFAQSAYASYSSDEFKIESGEKLAVAMFVSPGGKDITGRVATDILYLNLLKKGVGTVERQSLDTLMLEQELLKQESVDLSRKQIAQIVDRINNANYYVVGTIGSRKSEQVTINLTYWFNKKYLKEYNQEAEKVNKDIIRYNNQLYPIIKKKVWPLNEQIRLHNFAVMYKALQDKAFVDLINPEKKKNPYEMSEYEKSVEYFSQLHKQSGFSLAYSLDREYPSLTNLIGKRIFEFTEKVQAMREEANDLRNQAQASLPAARTPLLEQADSLDQQADKLESQSAEQLKTQLGFFKLNALKQLILSGQAKTRFGIEDANDNQPLIVLDVTKYNNLVSYYNELLQQAGFSERLVEAFATPPLVPLVKRVNSLTELYGPRQVETNYTNIELTMRFINTKTSEIDWIVVASRDSRNVNEALDLMFEGIVSKMLGQTK